MSLNVEEWMLGKEVRQFKRVACTMSTFKVGVAHFIELQ